MTLAIRPLELGDRRWVLSSWSRSYSQSRDVAFVPFDQFSTVMRPILSDVLDRTVTLVAHIDDVLIGFVTHLEAYVYYCYVKQAYRRGGVARSLFAAAGIGPVFGYACRTQASWSVRAKILDAKFDPFKARFGAQMETA